MNIIELNQTEIRSVAGGSVIIEFLAYGVASVIAAGIALDMPKTTTNASLAKIATPVLGSVLRGIDSGARTFSTLATTKKYYMKAILFFAAIEGARIAGDFCYRLWYGY